MIQLRLHKTWDWAVTFDEKLAIAGRAGVWTFVEYKLASNHGLNGKFELGVGAGAVHCCTVDVAVQVHPSPIYVHRSSSVRTARAALLFTILWRHLSFIAAKNNCSVS